MKTLVKYFIVVLLFLCVAVLTGCGNDDKLVALEQAIGDLQTNFEDIQYEKEMLLEEIAALEKQIEDLKAQREFIAAMKQDGTVELEEETPVPKF